MTGSKEKNVKEPTPPHTVWMLFAFLLCFYLIFMNLMFNGYDGEAYFVAENILQNRSVALSEKPLMGLVYKGGVPGKDGKRYGRAGFLEPILTIPMYILGTIFEDKTFHRDIQICKVFFVLTLSPILTALCGALVYLIAVTWYRHRTAISVALIYSLGTMAFPYSNLRSETVLVTCILLMLFGIVKYRGNADGRPVMWAIVAGVGAGAAIATKSYAPLLILPGVLLFIIIARGKGSKAEIAAFFMPIIVFSILEACYNALRFGSPFSTGYPATFGFDFPHLGTCLYVLFASPAKSAFMFSPVLIAGILAIRSFNKDHSLWFKFILAETLLLILFISTFREPLLFADEVWGSRYLFPVVFLWALVAGAWVERGGKRALVVYLSGIVGFLVSLSGVLIWSEAIFIYSERICEVPTQCRLLDPSMNAIVLNTRLLFGLGPAFLERVSHLILWWIRMLRPEFLNPARANGAATAISLTFQFLAVAIVALLAIGAVISGISLARSYRAANDSVIVDSPRKPH